MLPPPPAATSRGELFMSPVFNFSPPQPNIEMSGAATPRTSVRSSPNRVRAWLNPAAGSAFLFVCCGPVRLPSFDAHIALEGNLGTGQPFSYCYELPTQHRLESVATRTPPPICTSAQGSQTALVLRTVERREQLTVHDGWRLTITESHGC